jgi:tripartite ATP-independent transporter DctP family solute receptor
MKETNVNHLIRRRSLLALTVAAPSLAAPSASWAQPSTEIRIGYALPTTSHYGAGASAWGESVEKATTGRFKFKHFAASALGGEREMLEGLTLGSLDAAILSTGALGNFVPEVGVVDIPFLFRDATHARAVLDGPIGQELLGRFAPKGFQALAWGEQGFRHLTNSKRPVQQPADFQGLKIRTMENQVHITAFRALGALPTPMAWPEVVTGLQQGTIDGQENPISVIVSAKLAQMQKHLTLTGHVYSPTVLFVAKRVWDGLSAADKQAFQAGAVAGAKAMRSFVDGVEQKGVAELRASGMQVVTGLDNAAFQKALTPAYQQYEQRFGKALIDRIRSAQ